MTQNENEEGAQPEVRKHILTVVQDCVDFGRTTNYVPLGPQVIPDKKSVEEPSIDEGREYRLPG